MADRRWSLLLLVVALACAGGPTAPRTTPPVLAAEPPALQREFRGMWIATVANIDWPTQSGLTAAQQRTELIGLLDLAQSLKLTAVLLQVRAAGDAIYPSTLEPFSASLTGTQGGDPGWDPLATAVAEAHARGIELHAWFNPFRAGNASDTLRLHPQHFAKQRPELARVVRGSLWFDPGEQDVQDHAMRVVLDVVARYDIDGVHIDDYFYPYPTSGTPVPVPFPDSATYERYRSGAGVSALALEDWRRDNVNRFVERLSREVKRAGAHLKVGVSPFGIWRPGNPAGITGLDAWRDIYADSRLWLQRGWVDYQVPQLYWSIASTGQSFSALHGWWHQQNVMGRHVWPGLAAYRVADGTASTYASDEIPGQIAITRSRATGPAGSGFALYNATALRRDRGGLATLLRSGALREAAVTPAFPWIDGSPPSTPSLSVQGAVLRIDVAGESPQWFYVRKRLATGWTSALVPVTRNTVTIGANGADRVRVHAVDRAFNVSAEARWP